jgi:hypothetical protein
MKTSKLESLRNFKVLNETSMNIITGGMIAPDDSKKKDVSSNSGDSWKND